jgi:phosphotransferase system enzyme I (PtsI)
MKSEDRPATVIRKGIAVSPGVAVSKAYCIHETTIALEARQLGDEQTVAELARFNEARERTATDLRVAYQKVAGQVGPHEAAIFRSHEMILSDGAFLAQVHRQIAENHQTAEAALQLVLSEYVPLFASAENEYLRERLADLRDIVRRLAGNLSSARDVSADWPSDPVILVVDELLPSDMIPLDHRPLAGIVTQTGSQTSHAAILARSRGIPAVSGIRGILHEVQRGDTIIVDGHEGLVFIDPDRETERAYRKRQREYVHFKNKLAAKPDQPAVSADGQNVELLANISGLADAQAAAQVGAAGVGLFRTEYLFLAHSSVPDEDEQVEAYRAIIAASPGPVVTIRTVDLGGDKSIPYLGHAGEANPFMGWRSIRLSFEYPQFFNRQLRAILRAAVDQQKQIHMLFPMITTREEMLKVRRMVGQALRQLKKDGSPCRRVPLGLMVEVPAAAISIDTLLDVVDFVSIGSNDLVQYLTAADRDNPRVSHLCQPLSPAVLKVLAALIEACQDAQKSVTLCGEMAGAPHAFPLLFGMGLRSYSMSPAFIPSIKELLGHLTVARSTQILQRALKMKTTSQIVRFMDRQIEEICPNLKLMATI